MPWDELEAILQELPPFIPAKLPSVSNSDPIGSLANAKHIGNLAVNLLRPLVELLTAAENFRVFNDSFAVDMSGAGRCDIFAVINWMLHEKRRTGDAAAVVARLRNFMDINEGSACYVVAILGLEVGRSLQVAENIHLVPFDEVPASIAKDHYIEFGFPTHRAFGRLDRYNPTAALIFPYRVQKVIVPAEGTGYKSAIFEPLIEVRELCKTMTEITRSLTLVGPSAPQVLAMWSQYGDDVPIRTYSMTFSHSLGDVDPSVDPSHAKRVGTPSCEEIMKVVPSYLDLGNALRQRLQLPIDRLNLSMRRSEAVDRAIDLGIALESLLGDGGGSNDSISTAIRIRGAWLKGANFEERKAVYKLLRDLYSLRSGAVHDGRVKEKSSYGAPVEDVLWNGINLCSDLIKAVVSSGEWPLWDQLILGQEN